METMLQKFSAEILPAFLLILGVFNWCTTCCCGNSMILEILHCCCEHRDAEHGDSDHPANNPHPCHKQGGDAFLRAVNPDISHSPSAVHMSVDFAELDSTAGCTPSPVAAAWVVPRGAPPDIPLLTQRWLL